MRPKIALTMSMQDDEYFKAHTDYFEAIWDSGAIAVPLPYRRDEEFISKAVEEFDGFMFCGGSDIDPKYYGRENTESKNICSARDELEFELFRKAYECGKPILGICRGMQGMNVFLGGTMIQHIDGHLQSAERFVCEQRVAVSHDSPLFEILGSDSIMTNSFHHQAVDDIGEGLAVCAKSDDGVVEALYAPSKSFCVGVQWHPENFYKYDERSAALFSAFVNACKK